MGGKNVILMKNFLSLSQGVCWDFLKLLGGGGPYPPPISTSDHFNLDYTHRKDVRTVVETMMTACRTHHNRMHTYFKKLPSKVAALLKPHPDTTEEQGTELCDLFTNEAFMKNPDSGKINPAELYKMNYTNKDGIWALEGARKIYCDLEGKTYTEIEVYSKILGKKSGFVLRLGRGVKPVPSSNLPTQSSDLQHQLAKARDEIKVMRVAREKDLQDFTKKQAEMEAMLRTTVRSNGWSRSALG
ncbi:hypothetical protein CJ030_MR5G006250 [Morella rubra]|uniref:Uncharacterized protein n=1 Tax=Morella rubra TaxID=262757 RepID=A0A6A1VL25_9ROSI|nr:hypothetical protein CJ030_MR5G006250 [Morella rubra]